MIVFWIPKSLYDYVMLNFYCIALLCLGAFLFQGYEIPYTWRAITVLALILAWVVPLQFNGAYLYLKGSIAHLSGIALFVGGSLVLGWLQFNVMASQVAPDKWVMWHDERVMWGAIILSLLVLIGGNLRGRPFFPSWVYVQLARRSYQAGNLPATEKRLNQAIESNPYHVQALNLRFQLYQQLKQDDLARKDAETLKILADIFRLR